MHDTEPLPVPPLVLYGTNPVFLTGRWWAEGRRWAHISWIVTGEQEPPQPFLTDKHLPYEDISELATESYQQLRDDPAVRLVLPPLVICRGHVAFLRRWRRGGNTWWALTSRVICDPAPGPRHPRLIEDRAAAMDVRPIEGEDYRRVPRIYAGP
ncbi:hypothetical protein [Planomonospora parontospora]|uniref:hypothetical protein n=1 Tax=Planomonospora parontospora TaxID=58119 RepID=UPI00166F81F8|nr:hypothetical protein [Planomonospora parontospora]GGL50106.1 hypothetical protein GCM10014719_59190 [Planomonospora parontospora subsp. antibiotica]GII19261.1 hypothetical protein Ppa05_59870 [Planomonospora parontospora subsp. antibiotica]